MGTPLDFAYSPLDASGMFDDSPYSPLDISKSLKGDFNYEDVAHMQKRLDTPSRERIEIPKAVGKPVLPQGLPKAPALDMMEERESHVVKPPVVSNPQNQMFYDASSFNKKFEQDQMNTYMKQMQVANSYYQNQSAMAAPTGNQTTSAGYFDKLFSKKKEFFKLVQWVLIIVLAVSVHFFVKYYLKYYLTANDLTFEREMILRALYPLGILFILWNLRVFNKP